MGDLTLAQVESSRRVSFKREERNHEDRLARTDRPRRLDPGADCRGAAVTPAEARVIAKEATIYGFPLVDSYRVQYSYFVDRADPEFKAPWNTIFNTARVYTPDDKAVQTPNSDTPYSFVGADLRAEPLVLTVPAVEKGRYYSLQFIDMYTFNFAYVGKPRHRKRRRQLLAGRARVEGRDADGRQVGDPVRDRLRLRALSHPALQCRRHRQCEEDPGGLRVQTLSQFLGQTAPEAAPAIDFIKPLPVEAERTSLQFFAILNFVLQFCAIDPSERTMMARFARIGVGAGWPHRAERLSPELRQALADGMADAWVAFKEFKETEIDTGKRSSADSFGTRQFLNGHYMDRMSGAALGIYGNSKEEAIYPVYFVDSEKKSLNGANRYTLRFAPGQLPPVNASGR
jgi:hypothetical protein